MPGFAAREVAEILDTTEESVTSALKRARRGLQDCLPCRLTPPTPPDSPVERRLIAQLTNAYLAGSVSEIVALLSDDAWMTMPPIPFEYRGRDSIGNFLSAIAFRESRIFHLLPARANGQLALGAYLINSHTGTATPNDLLVLTLSADRITAITRFTPNHFPRLGLPPKLPAPVP
ncbi:hypothetical protein [Nocardia concava]|uniref:hypothetical protein n=1 Tax=Nocardia concava TaxID=257281 RepID=UPI00031882CA|nr:hypothetical protein [Nocardia concava]